MPRKPQPPPSTPTLKERVVELERLVNHLSERLRRLEVRDEEDIREKADFLPFHRGHKVIGKIPIWGSGRALIVTKTDQGTFGIEVL